MANYANLLATIAANIYTNGNNEVTAAMVKTAVDQMVASLGAGYQFMGVATPTNPGTEQTPDYKCFYLASTPGTYTYLGGLVIADGELALLCWNTSWTKLSIDSFNDIYATAKNAELIGNSNSSIIEQISQPTGGSVLSQELTANRYLDAAGEIKTISSDFYVGVVPVTPGLVYNIKYSGYAGNCGFAFVDSDGVVKKKEVISTSYAITERTLVAPFGAAELRIEYSGDTIRDVSLCETYTIRPNKWASKKWVVVGDSLTEVNARATKRYFDYVKEATGINVVNMGVSGSGYKRRADENKAFYQRIASVPLDADVITIFGSFNDNPYLSNIGDITDTGTDTLCGCVNTCLDNLFSAVPLANIGIVSPTPWESLYPGIAGADNYAKMLKDICERRGIPYYDLFHDSSLRPWDADYRALCYTHDDGNGVHPDETGHRIIAPRFENFLNALLL